MPSSGAVKVFVTGGSGFVGSAFMKRTTLEPRLYVHALQHRSAVPHVLENWLVHGALADLDRYIDLMAQADHVLWFAASRAHFAPIAGLRSVNVDPLRRAVARLSAMQNPPAFTYFSTISVLDATQPPDGPLQNIERPAPPLTAYGRSKLEAEEIVRSALPCHTILRLPFMYGPSAGPGTHTRLWRTLAQSGAWRLFEFEGRLSLLNTDDLADILVRMLLGELQWRSGRTYLLTDGCIYEVDAIIAAAAASLGQRQKRVLTKRIATAPAIRGITRLAGSKELRYWARLLTQDWCFAAEPDRPAVLDAYPYSDLEHGMSERDRTNAGQGFSGSRRR